ncbi:MAG: methylated-DNA--[protein]-cysteine S-methyltransferase [Clostridiales Family XIII bacterium]|nr:methylated-DNA--[protein]-cysteine S-methyltransferase [Clostridiales Family XIII bacterium]
MQYTTEIHSPVGSLTVASDGESITGLWIKEQKYFGATLEDEVIAGDLPVFESAREWLNVYFGGKNPEFTPPLAPKGSAFRQMVWNILRAIPYGEVTTYQEIAKRIATQTGTDTMSAQAVGGAVGHNPISIIIPCHRVIGTNGSLTGYAAGVEVKAKLLALEGFLMSPLGYRSGKGCPCPEREPLVHKRYFI